jgi:hypothetical protein
MNHSQQASHQLGTVAEVPFFCPIDSALNPAVTEVDQRALAWIEQTGICSTVTESVWAAASSSADFYGRFAPTARADRLLGPVCWVYFGFVFDDAHCDDGPMSTNPSDFIRYAGKIQRALETPSLPPNSLDDRYVNAIHEIGVMLRGHGSPVQIQRFSQAHRAWLFGVAWQIGNRAARRMPGLDEYLTMRLHSAGGEPTFALLELANGLDDIPATEIDSPEVRALTEMAIAVAMLDNDRHSILKEARNLQAEQNILSVLTHQHGYPIAEAAREAVALRDQIMLRFLELRQKAMRAASTPLRIYLTGLGHGMRGNAEWGQHVARYVSSARLSELPGRIPEATYQWTDVPSRCGRPDPTPPSIAWWWDL